MRDMQGWISAPVVTTALPRAAAAGFHDLIISTEADKVPEMTAGRCRSLQNFKPTG